MIPPALVPPPQYAEMAKSVITNSLGIHEFLNACEACGLPVQDRRDTLNQQVDFATKYLKNFHPDA